MRKTILIAALMLLTMAIAQTAPVEYTLKVTQEELVVISEGLHTQPFGKVAPLMNKLQKQVMDQQRPVEPPKVEVPK